MQKLILISLIVVSVSGCATMEWVNPKKSKEEFYQDKLACVEVANRLAWQRYPPTSVAVQNTIYSGSAQDNSNQLKNVTSSDPYDSARCNYREDSLNECLQSKGWVQHEIKPNPKK